MYSRILVPLDGSELAESALAYARLLGRALPAPVQLLQSVPAAELQRVHMLPHLTEAVESDARAYLQRVRASLREEGLEAYCGIHHGYPEDTVSEEGRADPSTLIAMATHGRSGVLRWALGSTTDRVLHRAREHGNHVLVVRSVGPGSGAEVSLQQILVPLDLSSLAERALLPGMRWAKALGLRLVLVTVVSPWKMPRTGAATGDNLEHRRQLLQCAEDYLSSVCQKVGMERTGLACELRVLEGDPASRIVDLAQAAEGCMIALTTHGDSGVGRWSRGSVADKVIRHASVPTLMVPP